MKQSPRVCILTSGTGSRMGIYSQVTNKALLPINGKAVLTQILEKFPRETEFVISLGYCGEDVQSYLELAHPDRKFHFVEIDKITGPGTGPGYSLQKCRTVLPGPFYFVSCDTLWEAGLDLSPSERNWFAAAKVPVEQSASYCNFKVRDSQITAIVDKEICESSLAFTGLCYIHDFEIFWKGLSSEKLVKGENQISNGIAALVAEGRADIRNMQWIDVGDEEKYKKAQAKLSKESFDFSKTDEFMYIVGNRAVKFFRDEKIAARRAERASLKPEVFPKLTGTRPRWYAYELVEGETLYKHNDLQIFTRLLDWLKASLWQKVPVDPQLARSAAKDFYQTKTLQRVTAYRKKHSVTDGPQIINGQEVASLDTLLDRVPWQTLCECVPVFFHGDLQFDNILINPRTGAFCLLDWRQDFAGNVNFGDLYYDYAKMWGGIIMNYDLIKAGKFSYREEGGKVFYEFASRPTGPEMEKQLAEFIRASGHDPKRAELLTALIFLNMSPLHHEPWDRLLYALGRQRLQKVLEQWR